MKAYKPEVSLKTSLLNVGRKLFTYPVLERMLVKQTLQNESGVVSKLIPPDYLYAKGSFRKVVRGGITYKLDISNVVDHFIYYGLEKNEDERIVKAIKNSNAVLDIGANIGNSALTFASINNACQIYAFEPHPQIYKRAVENLSLNSYSNIHLNNIGLGVEKAEMKLFEVSEHNPGMNRILSHDLDVPYKIIKIEPLDHFVDEKGIKDIGFVKIDVEGYEYQVLKGGENTLRKNMPVMFIELDDENLKEHNRSAKELIALLHEIGYTNVIRTDTNARVDNTTDYTRCHYNILVMPTV